jgi:hypothetical protein
VEVDLPTGAAAPCPEDALRNCGDPGRRGRRRRSPSGRALVRYLTTTTVSLRVHFDRRGRECVTLFARAA